MDEYGPSVFVLPHQDDELCAYHRIRALLHEGKLVHMVWVTDGAAHDPEIRQNPRMRAFRPLVATEECDAEICRIREGESRAGARAMGVPKLNLDFLAHPSGQVKRTFPKIVHSLTGALCRLQPREVYTVSFDQWEFEHDACNAAVRFAARTVPGATLYEFPVCNVYRGMMQLHRLVPCEGACVERTPFTKEAEQSRLKLYETAFPSQRFGAWAERISGIAPEDYRLLGEPYQLMPEHDYTQPLEGAETMYMPKSVTFDDFREMVAPYVA
jgi:LmbE family N-acetylglucosaminyl deacetylase